MPRFDPETWRLEIGGHVDQPISLDYHELLCAPEGRAGLDLPLRHRLDREERPLGRRAAERRARTREAAAATAHALEFVSAEMPYVDYLTMQQAGLHDVMLAYEMDGVAAPARARRAGAAVIPEMYGYKNVKWLKGINLVPGRAERLLGAARLRPDAWVGHSNGYGT